MVLTLELPIRHNTPDLHAIYEGRFGAPPFWLDEISPAEVFPLLRLALRRGAPLTPADYLN